MRQPGLFATGTPEALECPYCIARRNVYQIHCERCAARDLARAPKRILERTWQKWADTMPPERLARMSNLIREELEADAIGLVARRVEEKGAA